MVGFFRSIHIPIGLLASHDLAVRPVVEEKKVGWEWGVQDRAYLGCVPSSDRPFVGSSVRPSMRLSVRPLVRTYVPPCVRPSVRHQFASVHSWVHVFVGPIFRSSVPPWSSLLPFVRATTAEIRGLGHFELKAGAPRFR